MLAYIKRLIPIGLFRRLQPAYHFLMGYLAALYYRFPSRQLLLIGVTGTTGKTSTVYLIARILQANGYKSGYTSTAQFNDGENEWLNDKKMTMPGRFFLQRTLRRMVKNGCSAAVVETTSQGIEQFRHRFINYDFVLFTNLYPEHIEAHGSFENYKKAKGKLFAHLSRCRCKYLDDGKKVVLRPSGLRQTELTKVKKTIIVNGDDIQAPYFLSFSAGRKCAYTLNENLSAHDLADDNGSPVLPSPEIFYCEPLFSDQNGSDFQLDGRRYHLAIFGSYNIFNAAAALSVALALDIPADAAAEALAGVKTLAGKMEKIDGGQNFQVLVDYAFEPKALESLYQNIDLIPYRRLIHVLGSAGGGRDRSRRPILGNMAGKKADIVIVTDEDPYDEDPREIIDQVAAGAIESGKEEGKNLYKINDRRSAFRLAFNLASEGDLVLITGKGAEQYICGPKESKIPWDDRLAAREELEKI